MRPAALFAGYLGAFVGFRLLVLTFVTYFLNSSAPRVPTFDEISEVLGANEINQAAIAALLFVGAMVGLHPLTSTTRAEVVTRARLEKLLVPGLFHGALVGTGVIAAFLMSGMYKYLGFYIQLDEAPLTIAGILLRALSIVALIYAEEFIFRRRLLEQVRGGRSDFASGLTAAIVVSFMYCGVKVVQFDLGLMSLLTLFLLSMVVAVRTLLDDGDFVRGAGFLIGLCLLFHPLLSLPIFGNDFSGVVLVKYMGGGGVPALPGSPAAASVSNEGFSIGRFLTGGPGGPISSFCFQIILLVDLVRGLRSFHKKILWNPSLPAIK